MKKIYAFVFLSCLQQMNVHASETTPLVGYQERRKCHLQPCKDRIPKKCCPALCCASFIAGIVTVSTLRIQNTCAPADTYMTGRCWNAVRNTSLPFVLPNLYSYDYDKNHGPVTTSATASDILFSPEVAALAKLNPQEPIICLHPVPCRKK